MTMQEIDRSEIPGIDAILRDLPINTLFARAVVRGHAPGRVFGDDARSPRAIYVAHRYGMSLLFGTPGSGGFAASLMRYLLGETVQRTSPEWLQAWPDVWDAMLHDRLGGRLVQAGFQEVDSTRGGGGRGPIVQDTRVNFRFDESAYARMRVALELPRGCTIVDDVGLIFRQMKGSVVPSVFWDSPEALAERGAAFALYHRGKLASAAFASFAMDGMLELGIETVEEFRGRGFALHACSALIDDCLERRLEPVWACRLTNAGSYRLALKLGFVHARSLPYYRLPLSAREPVGTAWQSNVQPQ